MASKPLLSGEIPLVFIPDVQQMFLLEMAAGPVESQFIKELQKNPSDRQVRNEYADWLIDMGRSEFTEHAVRNTLFVPGGKVVHHFPSGFTGISSFVSGTIQPYPGIVDYSSGAIASGQIGSNYLYAGMSGLIPPSKKIGG